MTDHFDKQAEADKERPKRTYALSPEPPHVRHYKEHKIQVDRTTGGTFPYLYSIDDNLSGYAWNIAQGERFARELVDGLEEKKTPEAKG